METKGIELDKEREKSIHAKNIIIPILINSTHFHTLPHFWNFTNFKNPTSSFWSRETILKNPSVTLKKIYNDNLQPSPPSPASASYIPTPLAEGDRRATWRRKIPPPRPARGGRRPSDVINPTPEERRRDGDEEEKAPVLRKKLKGKGGGKGERA